METVKNTNEKRLSFSKDYVITGTLPNGRRFSPIYTKTPYHYNIWRGTVWEINKNTGKRKRVYTINN